RLAPYLATRIRFAHSRHARMGRSLTRTGRELLLHRDLVLAAAPDEQRRPGLDPADCSRPGAHRVGGGRHAPPADPEAARHGLGDRGRPVCPRLPSDDPAYVTHL